MGVGPTFPGDSGGAGGVGGRRKEARSLDSRGGRSADPLAVVEARHAQGPKLIAAQPYRPFPDSHSELLLRVEASRVRKLDMAKDQ